MASYLRYFLVRPGAQQQANPGGAVSVSSIVPLIAVDQLPEWIDIAGVPRKLTVDQTVGMSNLGTIPSDEEILDVRLHRETLILMLGAPDSDAELSSHDSDDSESVKPNESRVRGRQFATVAVGQLMNLANNVDHQQNKDALAKDSTAVTDGTSKDMVRQIQQHPAERMLTASRHATPSTGAIATAATSQARTPHTQAHSVALETAKSAAHQAKEPKGIAPPRSSSSYCRHWCHHGTCMWGLLCRYQHNMPMTLAGLQEVGLKDFPRWWITAMGLTLTGGFGVGGLGLMGVFGANNNKEIKKMREIMGMMPLSIAHAQLLANGGQVAVGTAPTVTDHRRLSAARLFEEEQPRMKGKPKVKASYGGVVSGPAVSAASPRVPERRKEKLDDGSGLYIKADEAEQQETKQQVSSVVEKLVDI
jgi:hypothetical protein